MCQLVKLCLSPLICDVCKVRECLTYDSNGNLVVDCFVLIHKMGLFWGF